MEKQPASSEDYDFIVAALKSLASAHANKGIERTLDKMEFLADAKPGIVNVDFGVAGENQEINGWIRRQSDERHRYGLHTRIRQTK